MSYLQFLLLFILPPTAALALLVSGAPGRLPNRAWWSLPALMAIAFLYTTPWDNHLVWRGIWGYGEDRVIGVIGYVPVEEYLFFLLQPLLTGLWLYVLLKRGTTPDPTDRRGGRWTGAAIYSGLATFGVPLLAVEWGTYLGLILVWSAPVLALQWLYAGREIWRRRNTLLLGVAVPTLYLWAADAVAIHLGIWHISEQYTTGLFLGNLPVEEAAFFLVTNLLVVQGLLLFLFPPPTEREQRTPPQYRHASTTIHGR